MRLKSKGFTLVELVIIIAVLGILAGIAIPRFLDAHASANGSKLLGDLRTIDSACIIYEVKNGTLPTTIDQLVSDGNTSSLLAAAPVPPSSDMLVTQNSGTQSTFTALDTAYKITDGRATYTCGEGSNEPVEWYLTYTSSTSGSTTTNSTSNSLNLTVAALKNLNIYKNGLILNGELKAALGGSFLSVEADIITKAFGTSYTGGTLTWHTDTATTTTQIFFAGNASSDNSNWAAYLVVVNGVLYKSSLTNSNGSIKSVSIAGLYNLSGTALATALASSFTVVGNIDY